VTNRMLASSGRFAMWTTAPLSRGLPPPSAAEEVVGYPQQVAGARPDERMVSSIKNDELRTGDPVVEHLRVVERDAAIVGGGDYDMSVGHFMSARLRLLSNATAAFHPDTIE
jgi:hypothetical protein